MSRTRSGNWPLRRIVEHWTNPSNGLLFEVLECGHKIRPKSDIYGTTHPARRRCVRCAIDRKRAEVALG